MIIKTNKTDINRMDYRAGMFVVVQSVLSNTWQVSSDSNSKERGRIVYKSGRERTSLNFLASEIKAVYTYLSLAYDTNAASIAPSSLLTIH